MKEETKNGILGLLFIASVVGVVLGIFYGIERYQNRSKFQCGDVVEKVYENEFKRTVYYEIVLIAGEEDYLTMTADSDGRIFDFDSVEAKYYLNRYDKAKKLPKPLKGIKSCE